MVNVGVGARVLEGAATIEHQGTSVIASDTRSDRAVGAEVRQCINGDCAASDDHAASEGVRAGERNCATTALDELGLGICAVLNKATERATTAIIANANKRRAAGCAICNSACAREVVKTSRRDAGADINAAKI